MISVIMPVYNGERTIRQAVLSTICNRAEVEVIVVDDGSTDRTPEILRKLQRQIPDVYVTCQRNMGPGVARNVALRKARGDFVTFLDADDYFAPSALDRMLAQMFDHDADACVAGTRYLLGGIPISDSIECWHELNGTTINAWDDNFLVEITPAVRAKMFRREVLENLEFSNGKWEDLAFIPAALARAGRIAILDRLAYNYRIHLNTTVKDFFVPCKVNDILVSVEILKENLQGPLLDDLHRAKIFDAYQSMLTLHTVFRMQNVMTWLGVSRTEKRQIILGLVDQLTAKYPNWREDEVLGDSEFAYKDPFFRVMLKMLYKYLD